MDNSLKFTITSSADTKGFSEADKALSDLERQAAIANQRLVEASQNDKIRESTLMSLQNAVWDYDQKLQNASGTEEKAATSSRGLTTSIIAGSAAYDLAKRGLSDVKSFMESSIEEATKYTSAIIGVSSVAAAMGDNVQKANDAAKQLSSDGLLTFAQAAKGLQNLLATGFNLPQAIEMMNTFKDTAAFGRKATLDYGTAVTNITQALRNHNETLAHGAGLTQNFSTMIREQGGTMKDFADITTNATAREMLLNGLQQQHAQTMGNAAIYANTYAGAQSRLTNEVVTMKQEVGQLEQAMSGGLLQSFAGVIGHNQQLIISLGAGVVVVGALVTGFFAAAKAIQVLSTAANMSIVSSPLFLGLTALSVLAGVVVFDAVGKMQSKLRDANNDLAKTAKASGDIAPAADQASSAMQKLADKLGDIDDQIAKANRDFDQSMAAMVQSHEDKVKTIQDQIADENQSYDNANAKKTLSYQQSQAKELDAHQKRVATIQKQIDNEVALGQWANQQTLRDLQDKLVQENDDYNSALDDKKQTYDEDVKNAKDAHDQKLADLQKQLDGENAFLAKHNAEVAAYRHADVLDEMQKLEQSHQDQLAAFAKQKQDAINNAKQTAGGVSDVWNNANSSLNSEFDRLGASMGTNMGNAFKKALESSFIDAAKGVKGFFERVVNAISLTGKNTSHNYSWDQAWEMAGKKATGGPVEAGKPYWVGDNPDGTLNATSELFVPNTAGTIIPAKQAQQLVNSSSAQPSGITVHQTNHFYTQYDPVAAATELGWRLSIMRPA